ncbi:CYTH domain-containing protein [Vallitalea longa]|uniref:CYTH domain-containing protein n=1 Tax=Vallitalea longa TaxID=2936439 RepID=A0A9W6DD41_9FIRM|nr:CYTH domain-containing protein [Vallitalea longa]GKX28126.1 CYTH domain-containing protein [Vallitalea longa]
MEIEKKYLITLPMNEITKYPHINIEQGYISTNPVIRIRKTDETCYLTYKSSGLMIREEFEEKISNQQYDHLKTKIDFNPITKQRYLIPLDNSLTVELDVFSGKLKGLIVAEVEFPSKEVANNFKPPSWFIQEVTCNPQFQNSNLCKETNIDFLNIIK